MSILSPRFRSLSTVLSLILLATTTVGCTSRPSADRPIGLNQIAPFGSGSAILLPGGDYHLVTVRQRPVTQEPVFCSEPSPDFAIAFGTALSAAANGSVPSGASAALSGSASTSEAITAMAGRTAGVVALRDGLYSACQAYANGVIGKDAYALILSQYGNLLVALAGGSGSGAASTAAATPATIPSGVAVAVSTGSPSGGPAPAGTASGAAPAGNSQVAEMQQQMIQALLVSCVSDSDQSIPDRRPNALLEYNCQSFMNELGAAVPGLLKPPTTSAAAATPSAAKPSATDTAAVKALQKILQADGDYAGSIDGVYGKKTATAYQQYTKKHPKPAAG